MLYRLIRPLLFRLEAERAHELVSAMLALGARLPLVLPLARAIYAYDQPMLRVECCGLRLSNPIGLAAGLDKRAIMVPALAALGFSHIEVGTVTPRPQPGNPPPRMFRLLEDRALVNRMGFNSPGMVAVARRLRAARDATAFRVPVGVNIGKNRATPLERAVDDYVAAFQALAPLADYVAINISSPNTPGLRDLHERGALAALLSELVALNRRLPWARPLLLKVSPDETPAQLDQVVAAALEAGVSGFIAGNTTVGRTGLRSPLRDQTGGLSGPPLTQLARRTIAHLHRATAGQLPIIGVGGISDAYDAYQHIRAGATLVQLYTSLVYQGPGVVGSINRGLVELLRRDGFATISEAIGVDNP